MTEALGFGMNGLEERICAIARAVAKRFKEVTYVEIGVGQGATLTGIARELRMATPRWRAIGVELENGYSFDRGCTIETSLRRGLTLAFEVPKTIVHPSWQAVTVYLKDSQSFLMEYWNEPIHFALIDGCHGKPCVIQDFLAIETFLEPSGVVMFHDFSEDQVGHPQPHCSGGIDVRGACRELGLLNGRRNGWKHSETVIGNRLQGGWDLAVFAKES